MSLFLLFNSEEDIVSLLERLSLTIVNFNRVAIIVECLRVSGKVLIIDNIVSFSVHVYTVEFPDGSWANWLLQIWLETFEFNRLGKLFTTLLTFLYVSS